MELSLFLAQVIGVFLILTSLSMLVDRRNIDLLFEAYRNPAVVYITGIFETMLGLVLILKHNIWTADFRVVITLVGWLLLARGLGRTCFPTRIPHALERFRTMRAIFVPLLLLIFFLGAYLAYRGFYPAPPPLSSSSTRIDGADTAQPRHSRRLNDGPIRRAPTEIRDASHHQSASARFSISVHCMLAHSIREAGRMSGTDMWCPPG